MHAHAVDELRTVEQFARQLVRVNSQGTPVEHHRYGNEPGEDRLSRVDVDDVVYDEPRVRNGERRSEDQR